MSGLLYLARRFVAGEDKNDALKALATLNKDNLVASLDFLGENVSNKEEAEKACQEYLNLLDAIESSKANSNVSVKLTQMGLDMGEEFCMGIMKRILERAASYKNFVRIDMEGSSYTQRTINIYKKLYETHKNVGLVIQAYLHRSENDVFELAKMKAPIRVCKGAYKESPSIAFTNMDDIRRNFKRLVEILLKEGSKVGIATHDEKLIQWAVEFTKQENIPQTQFEFQMLYGLRRKRARDLAKNGFIVRTYVPYGSHWFPYFYRRLRERKENIFFVLKGLVTD